jgi:hypothetical protein
VLRTPMSNDPFGCRRLNTDTRTVTRRTVTLERWPRDSDARTVAHDNDART